MGLVQIHVSFELLLLFLQDFMRILYITVANYLGQESIAGLFVSRSLYRAFSSIELINLMIIIIARDYCMILQTYFSLPLVWQIYLIFHYNRDHNERAPIKTQPHYL